MYQNTRAAGRQNVLAANSGSQRSETGSTPWLWPCFSSLLPAEDRSGSYQEIVLVIVRRVRKISKVVIHLHQANRKASADGQIQSGAGSSCKRIPSVSRAGGAPTCMGRADKNLSEQAGRVSAL